MATATPTPDWNAFSAALTGANGGASDNIYKNYAVGKVGADMTPGAYAGGVATAQAKIDEINQENAQAAAKLQAQKAQDQADPSKAQMVLLPNNQGYAFYDGTGQQININQYSLLTGKSPADILADSPVPKDQKFVQDYKTLEALSTAWVNGDTKTLDKFRAADPQKFNQIISTYKTPADLVNAFTSHWSDYYSTNPTNSQSQGTASFGPTPVVPDAVQKNAPATTTLKQVLTPQPTLAKPSFGGIGGSILSHIPGTSEHAALNNYNSQASSNPWFVYNNSLYGG